MSLVRIAFCLVFLTSGACAIAQDSTSEPIGLAAYTLKVPGFEWQTATSAHYRIHYLPGSLAEHQIDSLLGRSEECLASHLAILEATTYDKVIDLFYFDSRDQIKSIVTKPFRALADASGMTVLAVRNPDDVARDAHELMHVVHFDLWGEWDRRAELAWLSEGMATYADEPCNGHRMSELAAHILMHTDNVPTLDSLATSFRQYPEMIGYMLMESFIEFVIDSYGLETLHRLWDAGYAGFSDVFGKNVPAIEEEWHAYMLRHYPNPDVPDWAELRDHGCR